MDRMGSEPNRSVTIHTMVNFEGDGHGHGNGNGMCKQAFTHDEITVIAI